MSAPLKFRTPTRCQNGHFRWYYWTASFGRCEASWGPQSCNCPTGDFDQSFRKIGDDQQFSGLLDCNGAEVFDGDILRHAIFKCDYTVEWGDSGWNIVSPEHTCPLQSACRPNIRIVGNSQRGLYL